MYTVQRLNKIQAHAHLAELTDLLDDAVIHGAALGFLRPLDRHLACEFWKDVFVAMGNKTRILLVARDGDDIVGSVQLDLCAKQAGSHRAEVQKLLVLSRYRRKGVATALMRAVEEEARQAHRSLLHLTTDSAKPAERMYTADNWIRAGEIPNYARSPDGDPRDMVTF